MNEDVDVLHVFDFYPHFRFPGQSSQAPPLDDGNYSFVLLHAAEPLHVSDDDQIPARDGIMQLENTEQNDVHEENYECVFNCQITAEHF